MKKVNRGADDESRRLQALIVEWMQCQLERRHWTPERWAKEARIAPTTVTRAMSPDNESVTSVRTLHALARAANAPSVVDFLRGQTYLVPHFPILTQMLIELLPAVGIKIPDETAKALGNALGSAIVGMVEQPADVDQLEVARILAVAARNTIRPKSDL